MGPMFRAIEALSIVVQTLLMAVLGEVFKIVLLPYLATTGVWPDVIATLEGLTGGLDAEIVQLAVTSVLGAFVAGVLSVKACFYLPDGTLPGWQLAGPIRHGFLHSLTSFTAVSTAAASAASKDSSAALSIAIFLGCPLLSAAFFTAGTKFAKVLGGGRHAARGDDNGGLGIFVASTAVALGAYAVEDSSLQNLALSFTMTCMGVLLGVALSGQGQGQGQGATFPRNFAACCLVVAATYVEAHPETVELPSVFGIAPAVLLPPFKLCFCGALSSFCGESVAPIAPCSSNIVCQPNKHAQPTSYTIHATAHHSASHDNCACRDRVCQRQRQPQRQPHFFSRVRGISIRCVQRWQGLVARVEPRCGVRPAGRGRVRLVDLPHQHESGSRCHRQLSCWCSGS